MFVSESDQQRMHLLITISLSITISDKWDPPLSAKFPCSVQISVQISVQSSVQCCLQRSTKSSLQISVHCSLQSSVQRFPAPTYSGNHQNQVQKCFLYEIESMSLRAKISGKHNTSFYDLFRGLIYSGLNLYFFVNCTSVSRINTILKF